MYQVEQHQIKPKHEWYAYCEQTCFAAKNLFNTATYSNRQSFFYRYGSLTQAAMDKFFRDNEHYQSLPAKVSQLVLKQVAIDIGLDNLAMLTFSDPTIQPISISGLPLKSRNQWMNKELARLKSIIKFGTTTKIQNIIRNRNNYVQTYIHQASACIVKELLALKVGIVAIGQNLQWKTEINIGSRNNQNFVQIPHARFISMLVQKLEKVGITVMVGEESYTSAASFLDWDTIPIFVPSKSSTSAALSTSSYKFSGKRIKTKKYRSSNGTIIHADVNGSFNIGRKVLPDFFGCLQSLVMRNSGCVVAHPRRLNPFKSTQQKNMSGSAYI